MRKFSNQVLMNVNTALSLFEPVKPEVLLAFSIYLSDVMSKKDPNEEVPSHYIENELKSYLNDNFDIDPKIPLKK